jgi:uncharacterized protein YebE (UPF0316 family)
MEIFNNEILVMLFIFFSRVVDVSLGTIRIILVSRGNKLMAPLIGFFEVMIWLLAISKALENLSGPLSYIIYAAGFATGNYVGLMIEGFLAIGYQSVRVITSKVVSALPLTLREEGFGITIVEGKGLKGDVSILYTVIHKREMSKLIEIVNELEPKAFITIEDVKSFKAGFINNKSFFYSSRNVSKKK